MNANWKNKKGTGDRNCKCGSWKNHWINFSGKPWPSECCVNNCKEKPTLGAHVFHPEISGERIVPMCTQCNKIEVTFGLKSNTILVSANTSSTCDR